MAQPPTRQSPLSDAQLDELRALLDQREAVIGGEVRSAREADAERPSASGRDVGDSGEVGEELTRTGIEHAELMRDQEELQAIAEARVRMAEGRYGQCIDCGADIGFERLRAQPMASRCLACQTVWERTHRGAPGYAGG